jgi:hypothetical protein
MNKITKIIGSIFLGLIVSQTALSDSPASVVQAAVNNLARSDEDREVGFFIEIRLKTGISYWVPACAGMTFFLSLVPTVSVGIHT